MPRRDKSPAASSAAPSTRAVLLYVPNLIGYIRLGLILTAFFWPDLYEQRPLPFLGLYGASAALDGVDGFAARRLNQVLAHSALCHLAAFLQAREHTLVALAADGGQASSGAMIPFHTHTFTFDFLLFVSLSRNRNQCSAFGAWLDVVIDNISRYVHNDPAALCAVISVGRSNLTVLM
eukprot:SAG31_NODE_17912_length_653_cov_1.671480_1_plen_178_part_00